MCARGRGRNDGGVKRFLGNTEADGVESKIRLRIWNLTGQSITDQYLSLKWINGALGR